jgi:hypothetical protein
LNIGKSSFVWENNEGRVVKMTQEVYDLLRVCVEGKEPNDAVFTWSEGRPVKEFRGSREQLTKAAGVGDLLLHDFRRAQFAPCRRQPGCSEAHYGAQDRFYVFEIQHRCWDGSYGSSGEARKS